MKIMIICSKHHYPKIPEIKSRLELNGHEIKLPNSFDAPGKELEIKNLSKEEHIKWKGQMMRKDYDNISPQEAVLVLNLEKNGQQNYIGGATFLEMYMAWHLNKKLFLYNPIPESMLKDEILGMNPTIINGDLTLII